MIDFNLYVEHRNNGCVVVLQSTSRIYAKKDPDETVIFRGSEQECSTVVKFLDSRPDNVRNSFCVMTEIELRKARERSEEYIQAPHTFSAFD